MGSGGENNNDFLSHPWLRWNNRFSASKSNKKDEDEVKVKLTYFDAKARAELPRLIMAVAGIPFEDIRIKGEEWGDLKEGQFGKMFHGYKE